MMPAKRWKVSKTVSQVHFFKSSPQGAESKGSSLTNSQRDSPASPTNTVPPLSRSKAAVEPPIPMGDSDALTVGTIKYRLSQFKDEAADFRQCY